MGIANQQNMIRSIPVLPQPYGIRVRLRPGDPFAKLVGADWQKTLADFAIDLSCDGQVVDHGVAANVLDGPLSALRHFVDLLAHDPVNHPLTAGEIITTGTLTRANLQIGDIVAPGPIDETELLRLAAAAEKPSEHLLARAIVARNG